MCPRKIILGSFNNSRGIYEIYAQQRYYSGQYNYFFQYVSDETFC